MEWTTVVPWLSKHLVTQTVSSQIPQSKYLWQHHGFQWFKEIFQIAKMTTKHKHTVLSVEDKMTIYECLDKGSSTREIACAYKIAVFICFIISMYICLIIKTFDYLNKPWSQGGRIIEGVLYIWKGDLTNVALFLPAKSLYFINHL